MTDIELTEQLAEATSFKQVHAISVQAAGSLGFGQFLFGMRLPVPLTQPSQLILSGYSPTWRARYDEQGYMAIDPVLQRAMASTLPVAWDRIESRAPLAAQMFDEAAQEGLQHGLTLPVHGSHGEFSLLSLAGPDALPHTAQARMEIARRAHWFASHIHESVRRIALAPVQPLRGELPNRLSVREIECLQLAADGYSAAEIAVRLQIAERTVVFHFGRCQEKLKVGNRQQAIARAIALGEIAPRCYPERLAQSQQFVEPASY